MDELVNGRHRIAALQAQLDASEAARRADIERLMREIVEAEKRTARAELELELLRAGRLKPE